MRGVVLSFCPVAGCHALTRGGRCGTHRTADERRRHDKQRAHGRDTRHWRRLRKQRLELDGHRCTLAFRGCTGEATTVHLEAWLDGRHDVATLVDLRSACAHCHGVADAPRAAASRRAEPGRSGKSLTVSHAPAASVEIDPCGQRDLVLRLLELARAWRGECSA